MPFTIYNAYKNGVLNVVSVNNDPERIDFESIKCRVELFQHTQKVIESRKKFRSNPKQELNKLFIRA